MITRALGSPEGVRPDFFLLPLSAVERLLLCSDGITGMIDGHRRSPTSSSPSTIRATPPTRWCAPRSTPGVATTPRPSSIDVVGLVHDDSYDSERQLASLEDKLGARP